MRAKSEYPFFKPADLFIPVVVILILLTLTSTRGRDGSTGLHLTIHSEEGLQHLGLSSDTLFHVSGNMGPVEIQVENGRVRIVSSPCPGQDCVRQGWLSTGGDMAICVPSGVFIHLEAGSAEDSPDAVSY